MSNVGHMSLDKVYLPQNRRVLKATRLVGVLVQQDVASARDVRVSLHSSVCYYTVVLVSAPQCCKA